MTAESIFQLDHAKLVSKSHVIKDSPAAYRLARRKGELILQGAYRWQQGSMSGFEWRDIPIIELDEPEP